VHAHPAVINPARAAPTAQIDGPRFVMGGRTVVPREQAPLGRLLSYRRSQGGSPTPTGVAEQVDRHGWRADLGARGLGDTLLALGLVQALHDATGGAELRYTGPRPALMDRCMLPMTTHHSDGQHQIVHSDGRTGFRAVPEEPPTWLDLLDDHDVEVHAALPARYYLAAEQHLGRRLADQIALPRWRSAQQPRPGHIVLVTATSWPGRKDYGAEYYCRTSDALAARSAGGCTVTVITGHGAPSGLFPDADELIGPDLVDCIDVFASAELVIGNDTGLTHLAALVERANGSGPHVIGLYGRHGHAKWTTGAPRHHAIATPFSQLLSLADRCPVRDGLDDALWARAADLTAIPPDQVADFAAAITGW